MAVRKFILVALVIFFAGIAGLYGGVNRAPFRQDNPEMHNQHGHSQPMNHPAAENSSGPDCTLPK